MRFPVSAARSLTLTGSHPDGGFNHPENTMSRKQSRRPLESTVITVTVYMGLGDTHPRVLREMVEVVAESLSIMFEKWLSGEDLRDWKKGNITLICKKGRKKVLGNYGPVSLISMPQKSWNRSSWKTF